MSNLAERYTKHPFHNTFLALQTQLSNFPVDSLKGLEDARDTLDWINLVSDLTRKRLESTDPNLVPTQMLNNLNSSFQTITNELAAFKTDKNINRLNAINSQLDNTLVYLSNIVVPSTPTDVEAIRDTATTYRRSVGQLLHSVDEDTANVRTRLAALTDDLTKLSNEVNAQKQRTDAIISTFQQQFSTAEDKRRTEFNAAEGERKKRSDTLFAKKEAEWNQITKDKKSEYDTLLKQTTDDLAHLQSESQGRVNTLIGQIENGKKKAQDLVGVITDTGMVGGYQRVANEEKESARNWRKIALWSLIALVGFAVFAFVETLWHEFRWDQVGTRLFVAASFGILAAYAALQADKHERTERTNRRVELELASILPYLHDMPQEKQHKIREELAMRLFGQAEKLDLVTDNKTSGSVLDLLKLAMETITKLSKK